MADKQLLTQPFPAESIRQRQGAGRNVFDYVQAGDVIARVIQATDNEFGWTVDSVELIHQNEAALWVVRGTLTIAGLGSRDGIGTDLALNGDSIKSAETDAFKRAAVKFGVALHLYTDDAAPTAREQDAGTRKGNGSRSPQSEDRRSEAPARMVAGPSAQRPAYLPRVAFQPMGDGPCPRCHAPAGKPHATRCPVAGNGR
jgi:hypothetical protein